MEDSAPILFHQVRGHVSILALLVTPERIFAGTQDGDLLVWSLETFELLRTIRAHRASLLGLCLSTNDRLLFSCAGDAVVNVWDLDTLERLYCIYSRYDIGDVFCVAYSSALQCVYLGAQNTSIQWYDLSCKDVRPAPRPEFYPSNRNHRFFDSTGPTGTSVPRSDREGGRRGDRTRQLEVDREHVIRYAHYGYVYCMLIAGDAPAHQMLISGGGDGLLKLWSIDAAAEGKLAPIESMTAGDEPVLCVALDGTLLYSGRLEGKVDVWDLATRQQIRQVQASSYDIATLSVRENLVFAGSSDGHAQIFDLHHNRPIIWKAHDRLVLASAMVTSNGKDFVISGGNDGCVNVWDISKHSDRTEQKSVASNEELVLALAELVSYQTISGKAEFAHDCRKGASYLRGLFQRFGADTKLFPTSDHGNPIVYARFRASSTDHVIKEKPILFYGHYDVVPASKTDPNWQSDPFVLRANDGYLYGRGASDNKGPLLAAMYAAADLKRERKLGLDIVFLIEGEEESGSRGFEATVRQHQAVIGEVGWILAANSYWLTDNLPCLTYGLRGILRSTLEIQSERPDLHSGVDGSQLISEAMKDAVHLMAALSDADGMIAIPDFYLPIQPITPCELRRYQIIAQKLLEQDPSLGDIESLMASFQSRWREPSLTIHHIENSGAGNSSVMPRSASVEFSIRLVPNQTTDNIESLLRRHLGQVFAKLGSANRMTLNIKYRAEPWLGDPDSQLFQSLQSAVMDAWAPILSYTRGRRGSSRSSPSKLELDMTYEATGTKGVPASPRSPPVTSSILASPAETNPLDNETITRLEAMKIPKSSESEQPLYIREGGSIPAIRFLEIAFGAKAAHLPCGQASDKAHLDNERFRLINLYKSREIFRSVFQNLGGSG